MSSSGSRSRGPDSRGHAVVLGGSIAGLAAAAALAERFERVTVLDADTLNDEATPRRRAPQGHHVHAFLARGVAALEELLPGLPSELVSAGGVEADAHGDALWCLNGHRLRPARSGLRVVAGSRPFLEQHLRRRVRALGPVRLEQQTACVGLIVDRDSRTTVRGLRTRPVEGGAERRIEADLVVDAAGRASRLPNWLDELGSPKPAIEERVIDVGYSTRMYSGWAHLGARAAVLLGATAANPRGGLAQKIEGDRFLVTLIGYGGHHPSAEEAGFRDHATRLVAPEILRLVDSATPIGGISSYRVRTTYRLAYERLPVLPHGLLALGDAVSAFNPVYAQGMSVAALEALELRNLLRAGEPVDPATFFQRCARVIHPAWMMASGSDLRIPQVKGRRTVGSKAVNAWIDRVLRAGARDPVVAGAFLRVASLVDPPQALFRRSFVARVVGGRLAGGRRSSEEWASAT